jgi:hypothetical protein
MTEARNETEGPDAQINRMMRELDARQATDGNWYIRDPKRPGKYIMAVRRTQ